MQCEVVIDSERGESRVMMLRGIGPFSVGRNAESTIHLDSDMVSRQHALVRLGTAGVVVEDLSTNGTIAGTTLLRNLFRYSRPLSRTCFACAALHRLFERPFLLAKELLQSFGKVLL